MPDVYRRSKAFAALSLSLAEPATLGLLGQVAMVQGELKKTKLSLRNDIALKVAEMATGGGSVDIIIEVYDYIAVEYNRNLKSLKNSSQP